ncbi:MAG TPA: cytochrome P450 [Verrucomicrobiae bacterium]|nr:cytochrome P450 [Verrucomicrobiae bacterium]
MSQPGVAQHRGDPSQFNIERSYPGRWTITFSNPPINMFVPATIDELRALMAELDADPSVKVIVFQSANPDFFVAHLDVAKAAERPGVLDLWRDFVLRLSSAPIVSIAKIRGRTRGIGNEFALACDMRFAGRQSAVFGNPEVGVGLVPGGGAMEWLPRLIGRSRALEFVLSADDFDAEIAERYGWVNRALNDIDLDSFVDALALRLASFDRKTLATAKAQLNRFGMPTSAELQSSNDIIFPMLAWPDAHARRGKLRGIGYGVRSDFELNFGRYLTGFGHADDATAAKQPKPTDKTDTGFDPATFAKRFNEFSPEYGPHFREVYRHMRANCPVAHTDERGGSWVVTRYEDIARVARDSETFSSSYGVFSSPTSPQQGKRGFGPLNEERTGPLAAYPSGPNGEAPRLDFLPLELDPPLHGQYRKAVEAPFSHEALSEMAPWILALADQLIDAVIDKGEADFCRDLSTPLASIYTMKFLGLPLEDWSDYAWFIQSARSGSSSVQPRTKNPSELELHERVAAEVVRQRTRPLPSGVIAHLLEATIDGRKLETWEIEAFIWLLLGNVATTPAAMASGFVWLSRNPEQRRRIIERPELLPGAIEELLRVFQPFHALTRTVLRDVELGGQSLKAGEHVLLSWASGNLDETEFPNPDQVDLDRANKRHMSFGVGRHYCVGADTVRLEFQTMLGQILRRMPDFRVEEAGLRPTLVPVVVAGYTRVPFVFAPGRKVGGSHIDY